MTTDAYLLAEWTFLRSLCAADLQAPVRLDFCSRLRPDAFAGIEHRIIFQEICALTVAGHLVSQSDLREQLAARVTARGFPDLEFDDLLRAENLTPEDASARVERSFLRLTC